MKNVELGKLSSLWYLGGIVLDFMGLNLPCTFFSIHIHIQTYTHAQFTYRRNGFLVFDNEDQVIWSFWIGQNVQFAELYAFQYSTAWKFLGLFLNFVKVELYVYVAIEKRSFFLLGVLFLGDFSSIVWSMGVLSSIFLVPGGFIFFLFFYIFIQ